MIPLTEKFEVKSYIAFLLLSLFSSINLLAVVT